MKDNGVAPGTPLWMSPEVLQGKSLNEKVDVYSYGIVFWEMLTRKEPFEDMNSYDSFVAAVCDNQERPPIDDSIPKPLVPLLKACWHENPSQRPSFEQIIKQLDDIVIQCSISDPDGQDLWISNFLGKLEVPFSKFVKVLFQHLKVSAPQSSDVSYKCLAALLATKKDEDEFTSLEKFGLFLKWFGPMIEPKAKGCPIIDRMLATANNRWFHGDISKQESESRLATQKKGTFLVRLSTTEPERTPFTITKVNKKGAINHQRVYSNAKGYYVHIQNKGTSKKYEEPGSISALIKKVSNPLFLKTDCPGSKFNIFFKKDLKVSTKNSYLDDPTE
eukprot:TRINITY_DN5240_c0_g1_i2.p1 TRINITY_DN5240_c0_g1~~TRINITY_DN5240_c0_g1_i2.p1  ORF type:complete len:332 (-),score=55.29 TRINITY_DN5240_c0_g1_i2:32-1027(-)